MPFDVEVASDRVVITISGWDAVWCIKRRLEIPLGDITSARVDDVANLKREVGIRVGGGYLPNRMITGRFTVRGQKGKRQFWIVYRDREVLVIETKRDRYRRVAAQHPRRHELAAEVSARLAAHT